MAANHTIHYEISSNADLERLVADLPSLDEGTIIVAFDQSKSWHVTDLQMARLVATARTSGKQLIAERGTGPAAEQAARFGFRDVGMVTDSPVNDWREATSTSVVNDDPTAVIVQSDRFLSTANLATYRPVDYQPEMKWHSQSGEEKHSEQNDDSSVSTHAVSATGVTTVIQAPVIWGTSLRLPRATIDASAPAPSPTGPAKNATAKANQDGQVLSQPTRRWPKSRVLKLAAAIVAPLLVLTVIGAMALYMLPTADVILVAEEEPISASLTYGVAISGESYDISVDPTSLSSESSAEATRQATGERFEPAGTAAGTIQITNPLTNEVTIPAGTEIPGANGVTYYTAEDVRLPAADPFGSQSFGSGSVGVYAGIIGPNGNLDAGALTGQLGTQMFYTNPGAIAGGRMDRYPVINEDDVNAVRGEVESALAEIARDEFMQEIPESMELVPGSIEIGQPDVEVSASAGDDGESVSAAGTISVSGQVYDPSELHEIAGSEADRQLARQGGSEHILLAESVTLRDPTDLPGETPAFKIDVEAMARKVITESEREAIIGQLAGLSRSEAEAILEDHPKVERFQVDIQPDWLLDRMPEIASRIDVHVSSGESTASTR